MAQRSAGAGTILWWGRSDAEYSRNRILRSALRELGWTIRDFRPAISQAGDVEAALRVLPDPDLLWVPCFRQRDMAAAIRFARRRRLRLLFDPLISAWEKQVFERRKMPEDSIRARRLRQWEGALLCGADLVLADTAAHARFFADRLGVEPARLAVVPVGAEEPLFHAAPMRPLDGRPIEVLFYGSFIGLHGPECIVEAARLYDGSPVRWTLLGDGPHKSSCQRQARDVDTVSFEPWDPYTERPKRVHRADILLGVFGSGDKAGRVIPNKVYQSLACGRPVITRDGEAYPRELRDSPDSGLALISPGDPAVLAATIRGWAAEPERLSGRGAAAADLYARYFGSGVIRCALADALERVLS